MSARGTKVTVRVIAPHVDLADILQIEESSFEHPWQQSDFQNHLRQKNCGGIVAESGNFLVGYAIFYVEDRDLFVANFAVAPDCRRCGVGTRLVGNMLSRSIRANRTSISLTVARPNTGAVLFWRWHKFQVTRLLTGFFAAQDGTDAWEMRYVFNN